MKPSICCIGHITLDKVVTPQKTVHMPGGTVFYGAHALSRFAGIDYRLVTAVGAPEMHEVETLKRQGIDAVGLHSAHSVCFENIYGDNPDERRQRVSAKADAFTIEQLKDFQADVFHLGALLADDFSPEVVASLAARGRVAVDAQGYLREVRGEEVFPIDWEDKMQVLPHIYYLKVNEHEMEVLTGNSDPYDAALILHRWGVREVLVTLGSMGSLIFDGVNYYRIPAFRPSVVTDATGCGDTYTSGYLYRRLMGADVDAAGRFAAAMSTLKIENFGPFAGTEEDVLLCMTSAEEMY